MTKTFRVTATALLLVIGFLQAAAANDERGWSFSQRFQGSSNSAGLVLKTNSTIGFSFNRFISAYGGVPVYFVRPSSADATTSSPGFINGVGNIYTGLLLSVNRPELTYSSDLVFTAPTGNRDRGFSTGQATVDWTNNFSRSFSSITPYASLGVANTVSDTSFFVRPFSSKGLVGHFEGGALFDVAPRFSIGGSGYGIRASGEQQVISKVIKRKVQQPQTTGPGKPKGVVFETVTETTVSAQSLNDRGVSTWFTVRPSSTTDFQVGFSRSVTYQLNSLFFGIGFRVGN